MNEERDVFYGLTVVNPSYHAKIIGPPPPTWRDHLRFWWDEVVFPAFLVACSVTAFQIAFGLL